MTALLCGVTMVVGLWIGYTIGRPSRSERRAVAPLTITTQTLTAGTVYASSPERSIVVEHHIEADPSWGWHVPNPTDQKEIP